MGLNKDYNNERDQLVATEITSVLNQFQICGDIIKTVESFLPFSRVQLHANTQPLFKWANLAFSCCEFVSGKFEQALTGAVAMELFALAADIFDDIQDQDNDQEPWRKIPLAESLNIATILLMLSSKVLYSYDAIDILSQTGLIACQAQYQESIFNKVSQSISLSEYLELVKKKSGSLTSCACQIGGIFGEASTEIIDQLGLIGIHIGVIAQISNDLVDFRDLNKNDFIKNRKTFPYLYLMHSLKGEKNIKFMRLLDRITDSPKEITSRDKDELEKTLVTEGAVHYCLVLQELHKQNAMEIINNIGVHDKQKGKLIKLVQGNT